MKSVAAAAASGLRPGLRRAAAAARTPDQVRNSIVALVQEQRYAHCVATLTEVASAFGYTLELASRVDEEEEEEEEEREEREGDGDGEGRWATMRGALVDDLGGGRDEYDDDDEEEEEEEEEQEKEEKEEDARVKKMPRGGSSHLRGRVGVGGGEGKRNSGGSGSAGAGAGAKGTGSDNGAEAAKEARGAETTSPKRRVVVAVTAATRGPTSVSTAAEAPPVAAAAAAAAADDDDDGGAAAAEAGGGKRKRRGRLTKDEAAAAAAEKLAPVRAASRAIGARVGLVTGTGRPFTHTTTTACKATFNTRPTCHLKKKHAFFCTTVSNSSLLNSRVSNERVCVNVKWCARPSSAVKPPGWLPSPPPPPRDGCSRRRCRRRRGWEARKSARKSGGRGRRWLPRSIGRSARLRLPHPEVPPPVTEPPWVGGCPLRG